VGTKGGAKLVYKHILVATDGSELSERAIEQAIGLARALNARVTALHVIRPWRTVAPGEIMVAFPESEYLKGAETAAARYVGYAEELADEQGVSCDTTWLEHGHPWQAILSTAEARGCDLIVMASHGRKGLAALFLGSETQKVLAHSKIPVLVCR
jgi:nucleotide-binding universal stress UspA family protein